MQNGFFKSQWKWYIAIIISRKSQKRESKLFNDYDFAIPTNEIPKLSLHTIFVGLNISIYFYYHQRWIAWISNEKVLCCLIT